MMYMKVIEVWGDECNRYDYFYEETLEDLRQLRKDWENNLFWGYDVTVRDYSGCVLTDYDELDEIIGNMTEQRRLEREFYHKAV